MVQAWGGDQLLLREKYLPKPFYPRKQKTEVPGRGKANSLANRTQRRWSVETCWAPSPIQFTKGWESIRALTHTAQMNPDGKGKVTETLSTSG